MVRAIAPARGCLCRTARLSVGSRHGPGRFGSLRVQRPRALGAVVRDEPATGLQRHRKMTQARLRNDPDPNVVSACVPKAVDRNPSNTGSADANASENALD